METKTVTVTSMRKGATLAQNMGCSVNICNKADIVGLLSRVGHGNLSYETKLSFQSVE